MRKCHQNWHRLHPKADQETTVLGAWLRELARNTEREGQGKESVKSWNQWRSLHGQDKTVNHGLVEILLIASGFSHFNLVFTVQL